MAVQMKASVQTNVRSDFMISDAAMAQRMAALDAEQAEQAAQFAKILGGLDSKNVDTGSSAKLGGNSEDAFALNDIERALNEMKSDDEKFERALKALDAEIHRRATSADDGKSADGVFCNKRTGEELPNDPQELAEMVVEGKLNLNDIPDELLTPELMNVIIALMVEQRVNDGEEPKDEENGCEDDAFDPAVAAVNEQKLSREVSAQMLRELYGIVEKHNENESGDKETILDGISEPIDENETLHSIAAEDVNANVGESVFEEIIDGMAESIVEDAEEAEQAKVNGISDDLVFPTEAIDVSDTVKAVEAPEVSTVQEQTVEAPVVQETAASDVVSANEAQTDAAVQTDAAPVIADANEVVTAPKQTETQNLGARVVQASEDVAEQVRTVQQSGQSDGAQMQFGAETQSAERTGETSAANWETSDVIEEFKSVVEAVTVKNLNGEVREADKAKPEVVSNDPQSRVRDASEELEMLKSAKLAKAKDVQNDDGESTENPVNELKNGETANPLMSDQPIVFKRADGTEVEVKPSEIVNQAQKLIEKAVEEAREQSEYSLILNPEELGRITVKLIKSAEGTVSVTIAAENARTQRILEQHSELMQNNLRSNGVNLESWQTVAESRQETYAQDYNGSSKNPYFRRENAQHSDDDNNGDRTFADLIASM